MVLPPHDNELWQPIDNSPWGWHDVGVQLTGEAAKGVWANFYNRWLEVSTLPVKHYVIWHADGTTSLGPFNPGPLAPTPDPPPDPGPDGATYNQSVQILRSRYRWKIPDRFLNTGVDWTVSPQGPIYNVYDDMKKAIGAATQYIYIEDQFLDESVNIDETLAEIGQTSPWAYQFSLYPEILKALLASDTLRAIFVSSGKSDPSDIFPDPDKNKTLTPAITRLVQSLPTSKQTQIAVWRVKGVTVHSKLMLIDDQYAAIGSANFHSRSMFGTDEELHTAFVATDSAVKDLRCQLWAEHWNLDQRLLSVYAALQDISQALGLWRTGWASDQNLWRMDNDPQGFINSDPNRKIAPVGP